MAPRRSTAKNIHEISDLTPILEGAGGRGRALANRGRRI